MVESRIENDSTRRVGVVLLELFDDSYVPSLTEEYNCWELLMFLTGNPVGDFNKSKSLGLKVAQGEREKLITEATNAIFDWIESKFHVIVPERRSEIQNIQCHMTLYGDWCDRMESKWMIRVFEGMLCGGCPFCHYSKDPRDTILYCEALYAEGKDIIKVNIVSDRNNLMPWQCPIVEKGEITERKLFAKVQEGGRRQKIYYFKQQVQNLKELYAEEKIDWKV